MKILYGTGVPDQINAHTSRDVSAHDCCGTSLGRSTNLEINVSAEGSGSSPFTKVSGTEIVGRKLVSYTDVKIKRR